MSEPEHQVRLEKVRVQSTEAHQRAVIGGGDRQIFRRMVAEALERRGMPVYTSEKERSKRLPWL